MSVPCEQKDNINKILDRVTTLEISKGQTDILIERFIDTTKELSSTMKQVELTMVGIQSSQENSANEMKDMNKKIDKLQENEEKNKIDTREILKSILIKGGVGVLSLYGIYELISKGIGE